MKRARIFAIIVGVLLLCVFLLPKETKADPIAWDGSLTAPTVMRAIDGVYYYEISTPAQLAYVATTGGAWHTYNYILVSDLVMNDATLTYDAKGNMTADASGVKACPFFADFQGIFDGNGHFISGLYITGENNVGLFGKLRGSVKNLTIKNAYICGTRNVGGICGFSDIANHEISNCNFYGAVKGTGSVAGITGSTDGYSGSKIVNCINYGDIFNSGDYTGGIVGNNNGAYTASISNCVNNGRIVGEGNYVGGITGSYFWYIINCVNNGSITGKNMVAGITGAQAVVPGNCINNGAVTGEDIVGGIMGLIDRGGDGEELYNTGCITGKTNVGGICGSTKQSFDDEFVRLEHIGNSGEVKGESNVGGLLGYGVNIHLKYGVNIAKVTGSTEAGNLIGHSETIWGRGSVANCYYLAGVNSGMLGFGNAPEDTAGIAEAKDSAFFCVKENKTVSLHNYTEQKYDEQNHWMECVCGKMGEHTAHTPNTTTRDDWYCTACDYEHEGTNNNQQGDSGNNNNSNNNNSNNNNSNNNNSGNNDSGLGIFGDGSRPKKNNTGTIIVICILGVTAGVGIAMFAAKKKQ